MILKEDIEKVRATADLYDIVSATVTLKPSGTGTYVGLCPFHDEKTPSFSVRPALGVWHCFGCGEGGDVFAFIMKSQDLSFPEAVRYLAERAHIDIADDQGKRGPGMGQGAKARLRAVCARPGQKALGSRAVHHVAGQTARAQHPRRHRHLGARQAACRGVDDDIEILFQPLLAKREQLYFL